MAAPDRTSPDPVSALDRAFAQPVAFVGLGVALAVAAFALWTNPANPPGFIRDEASIAYNAHTISQNLRDQDGGLLPLYLVSFDDYKSPLFVYVLAGVFRITGPDPQVARTVAALCVLAAVLLLGLLAYRRTRRLPVALAVLVVGGLTPWLYELGRVAYETCAQPLALACVLLATDWAYRSSRAAWIRGVPVGLALGSLTYVYAAGRLLAPLLAVALLVFAGRGRWTWLAVSWGTFVATLLPLAAYAQNHPGALTARYQATTFITDGTPITSIFSQSISHYVHDLNLWHWVVSGDPKPYIHSHGAGSLFAAVVLLAIVGVVVVLREHRDDLWWRFVLAAFVLGPVPAALTEDRFYALRLVPIPVILLVLAIPGLDFVLARSRGSRVARTASAALLATVAVQFAHFLTVHREKGPARTELFEAQLPALLEQGFARPGPVYTDLDDRYAQTHALWYAVSRGVPAERVSILPDGGIPPDGATVFGRFQPCDYVCPELGRAHDYWLATAAGPKTG